MRWAFIVFIFTLLLVVGIVSANGGSSSPTFPVWTYYAEIVEHSALIIAAVIGIILMAIKKMRDSLMVSGLVVIILSQVLVNLHHFLIYPFGEWNAIVHHGLLVAGFIIMIIAYFKGGRNGAAGAGS